MIDATTQLGAVIGFPVSHSLSPLIYNTALKHSGLNAVYLGFETTKEEVSTRIDALKNLNVFGINVTTPGKEIAMDKVDQLDEVSSYVGALNTITKKDGQWKGFNTDGAGFWDNVQAQGVDLKGKNVCLFGSGGTTRVILAEAVLRQVSSVTLVARNIQRPLEIKKLIEKLCTDYPKVSLRLIDLAVESDVRKALQKANIVINSTSVGMKAWESIIKYPEWLSVHSVVCDVVYQPLETKLLKDAKSRGCQTIEGLGMLIHQAKLNYQIYTNKEFPLELVEEIIKIKLNRLKEG